MKRGTPDAEEGVDAEARKKHSAKRKGYVTSTKVARMAGVSQSAVSRTFTKGGSVSAKTRKKILKVAEQVGYLPSVIPRMMSGNHPSLIAVIIGGMYNPYFTELVDLIAKETQRYGNSVLLFSVNNGEYIDEVIPLVSGYRVNGILSALSIISAESAELCAKMRVPVVLLNGKVRNEWISSVCSDNVAGARDIADLFLRRHIERFGFISGKSKHSSSEERFAGYLGRLAERGVRDVALAEGQYSYEGGYRACCELMSRELRPQAIFCANDLMAIGALEAARSEFGLRVPEDLLVAGFDDIPAASWPSIQLTTIRQHPGRLVQEALSLLERRIEGAAKPAGALRIIPVELVERHTTAKKVD